MTSGEKSLKPNINFGAPLVRLIPPPKSDSPIKGVQPGHGFVARSLFLLKVWTGDSSHCSISIRGSNSCLISLSNTRRELFQTIGEICNFPLRTLLYTSGVFVGMGKVRHRGGMNCPNNESKNNTTFVFQLISPLTCCVTTDHSSYLKY
jgi:hypothetical protein